MFANYKPLPHSQVPMERTLGLGDGVEVSDRSRWFATLEIVFQKVFASLVDKS